MNKITKINTAIQRTLPPIDIGESVIQRYHAQNVQATSEEFELMLSDGLTPAERRMHIDDNVITLSADEWEVIK